MGRKIGTVSMGVRAPIIKQGDPLADIVTDAIVDLTKEGIVLHDRDVVAITEAVVARSQGNYATIEQIAADVSKKFGNHTVGVIFPILSRNRFSVCLKGIAKGLKSHNPQIKAIAVEPESSQVLAGKPAGAHKIQGIGANFVPKNFDYNVVDEIIPVSDEDAFETARKLAKAEGILCGISSGAAMYAAAEIAKRHEYKNKMIVVILPDSGERYLSSELFN